MIATRTARAVVWRGIVAICAFALGGCGSSSSSATKTRAPSPVSSSPSSSPSSSSSPETASGNGVGTTPGIVVFSCAPVGNDVALVFTVIAPSDGHTVMTFKGTLGDTSKSDTSSCTAFTQDFPANISQPLQTNEQFDRDYSHMVTADTQPDGSHVVTLVDLSTGAHRPITSGQPESGLAALPNELIPRFSPSDQQVCYAKSDPSGAASHLECADPASGRTSPVDDHKVRDADPGWFDLIGTDDFVIAPGARVIYAHPPGTAHTIPNPSGTYGVQDVVLPGSSLGESCLAHTWVDDHRLLCAPSTPHPTALYLVTYSNDFSHLTARSLLPPTDFGIDNAVVSPDLSTVAFIAERANERVLFACRSMVELNRQRSPTSRSALRPDRPPSRSSPGVSVPRIGDLGAGQWPSSYRFGARECQTLPCQRCLVVDRCGGVVRRCSAPR